MKLRPSARSRAIPASERHVTLAAIVGAHGVVGEVRLKLFAGSLASLKRHAAFDAGDAVLTLTAARDTPTGPIARFAEVTTREAADALRGRALTVPRAALPPPAEDEVYVADLIGLPVFAEGRAVGVVAAVEDFGAGPLLDIVPEDGAAFMVPFRAGVADLADGRVTIDVAYLPG